MAETLPINIPLPASNAVASYDWFDFGSGAGYKTFYLASPASSAGNQYIISSTLVECDVDSTGSGNLGTGAHELNWDITFNRPIIIANATVYFRHKDTAVNAGNTVSMNAELFHVRDAVETSLGSATGSTLTGAAVNKTKVLKFTVSRKSFAIGDTLRLSTTFTVNGTGSWNWDAGTSGNEALLIIPFEVKG